MCVLQANNLGVKIGDRQIVTGVSFSVQQNDWLMLCGPNGAGKSTIIKAISQNLEYSGTVTVSGENTSQLKPTELARKMAVFSQNNFLEYGYTVNQVVMMGRFVHKKSMLSRPSSKDENAVQDAIEKCGLAGFEEKSVQNISGGELQRVFLAQALAQDTSILVLDEPTNHLDIKFQDQIFSIIDNWRKQPGHAVISAIHDLAIAKRYGNKAILLNEGSVISSGAVEEVLTQKNLQYVYKMDVVSYMQSLYQEFSS